MDSQRRDTNQRLIDLDELLNKVAVLTDEKTASETEIPVEPRVPDTASICLDTDLQEADLLPLGNGLDAEAWGVCVCANDGNGISRSPLAANSEGNNGGAVPG